ncbi:hypothetical protein L2E82_36134 [Cichorium intybus]|uniref:Uncharacterized protein n=1 Tax=Cichorium intybus TaxID=13427 RepID=A0ACB9BQU4_CICIN|nr:hypothetical protein L2E82_36134 [Cichorium intybus]
MHQLIVLKLFARVARFSRDGNKNGKAPNQSNRLFDKEKCVRLPSVSFVDVVKGGVRDKMVKTEKTKQEEQEPIKSDREHVGAQEVEGRLFSPSCLKGSDEPTSEGDDAEEDDEDMTYSEEDDLAEQSDEVASEWGTDLEVEDYSGEVGEYSGETEVEESPDKVTREGGNPRMLSDHDENPRMLSDRDVNPVVPDTVFEKGFIAFNERNEEKRGQNVLVDEAIEIDHPSIT